MSEEKSLTLAANANDQVLFVPETAHTLKAEGHDASEDGTGRGVPIVPAFAFDPDQSGNPKATHQCSVEHTPPLIKARALAVAFDLAQITSSKNRTRVEPELPASTLNAAGQMHVAGDVSDWGMAVRRLTPRECERLQGFPDDYTRIPWRGKGADDCPDGPRYKALGNSMAVPVMRWIGQRIAQVDEIIRCPPSAP